MGAPNIIESFTNKNNPHKSNFTNTELNNKRECASNNYFLRKTLNFNTNHNKSGIINQVVKTGSAGNKSSSHRSIINIREINKINR